MLPDEPEKLPRLDRQFHVHQWSVLLDSLLYQLFRSVTVGAFLGTELTLLVMRAFRLRIAHLEARLVAHTDPDRLPEGHEGGSSPLMARLRFYSGVLAVGSSVAGVALMMLMISAGTAGIYESGSYLLVLSVFSGLGLALLGILGMTSELVFITRAVSVAEQRLDASVAARPGHADAAIRGMQSLIHKFTGVQGWQSGVAAP